MGTTRGEISSERLMGLEYLAWTSWSFPSSLRRKFDRDCLQSLAPQPPLQVFRPHPHPIQNPPGHRYDCNGHKMKIAASDTSISRRHKTSRCWEE
ncbi:hypothetical protein SLA2020_447670 [Shorea laevis]